MHSYDIMGSIPQPTNSDEIVKPNKNYLKLSTDVTICVCTFAQITKESIIRLFYCVEVKEKFMTDVLTRASELHLHVDLCAVVDIWKSFAAYPVASH